MRIRSTRNGVLARVGAEGDVTGTERVTWERTHAAPYVPSPLLYGEALYFLSGLRGILNRVGAQSGEDRPGSMRLRGMQSVFASPVGAGGRVYVTDRRGMTVVLSHAREPRVLAVNRLDDHFSASAAVVGRELYLRGEQSLYCIAE